MPTMQVVLTPQHDQLIKEKVASGMFRDPSDVICEALRNLDTNSALLNEMMNLRFGKALKPAIEEADRGDFSEKTFDEIIAEAGLEDS